MNSNSFSGLIYLLHENKVKTIITISIKGLKATLCKKFEQILKIQAIISKSGILSKFESDQLWQLRKAISTFLILNKIFIRVRAAFSLTAS